MHTALDQVRALVSSKVSHRDIRHPNSTLQYTLYAIPQPEKMLELDHLPTTLYALFITYAIITIHPSFLPS